METKVNRLVPFKATHPGEILGEELKARGIKQKAFAEQIGMQSTHLNELIKGKRNVTSDVAIRLENALGIPYKTWMNLQNGYDYDCKMIAKKNEEEMATEIERVIKSPEIYSEMSKSLQTLADTVSSEREKNELINILLNNQ